MRFEERQPYVNKANADRQRYETETARLAGPVAASYQRPNMAYALEAGAGNTPQRHYKSEVGAGNTPQMHYKSEADAGNTPQRHYKSEAGAGNTPDMHYKSEAHAGNTPLRHYNSEAGAGNAHQRHYKSEAHADNTPQRHYNSEAGAGNAHERHYKSEAHAGNTPQRHHNSEARTGNTPERHYKSEAHTGNTPLRHYNSEAGAGNAHQRHYKSEAHAGNTPQRHYNSEAHTGNTPQRHYNSEAGAGNAPQRHYKSEAHAGNTPQRHYNSEAHTGNTPQRHYKSEAHTGNTPQRHCNSEAHASNSSRAVSGAATGNSARVQDPPATPPSTHCKSHPFGTGAEKGRPTPPHTATGAEKGRPTVNPFHAHYRQGPRQNNMRTAVQSLPPNHPMVVALNAAHQRAVEAALTAGAPPLSPPHLLGIPLGADAAHTTTEAFGDNTAYGGHDTTKQQCHYSESGHGENNSPGTSPMADQHKYLDELQQVAGPLGFTEDAALLQTLNENSALFQELQQESNRQKSKGGQEHGHGGAYGFFDNDESDEAFDSMYAGGWPLPGK
eukprot:gene18949-25519_t